MNLLGEWEIEKERERVEKLWRKKLILDFNINGMLQIDDKKWKAYGMLNDVIGSLAQTKIKKWYRVLEEFHSPLVSHWSECNFHSWGAYNQISVVIRITSLYQRFFSSISNTTPRHAQTSPAVFQKPKEKWSGDKVLHQKNQISENCSFEYATRRVAHTKAVSRD